MDDKLKQLEEEISNLQRKRKQLTDQLNLGKVEEMRKHVGECYYDDETEEYIELLEFPTYLCNVSSIRVFTNSDTFVISRIGHNNSEDSDKVYPTIDLDEDSYSWLSSLEPVPREKYEAVLRDILGSFFS